MNMTINATNDPPSALDDTATVVEDSTANIIDVLANDSDVEGTALTITDPITITPSHGTVSVVGNKVSYTPDPDYNGIDSLTYQVCDSGTPLPAECAMATLTITVDPVNDLPVVSNGTTTGTEDTTLTLDLPLFESLFADVDMPNKVMNIRIETLPANGTLMLDGTATTGVKEIPRSGLASNKLTFEPDADWNGTTSFDWKGSDGTDYSASAATLTITITPVNDPPTLTDGFIGGLENPTLTFSAADFTSHFSDVDTGDSLVEVRIESLPTNGTLKLSGTAVSVGDVIPLADLGNLTFEPNTDWVGVTDFYWNASDGTDYAAFSALTEIGIAEQLPWSDDMEGGVGDWTATGLWHLVDGTAPAPSGHKPAIGTKSWWYGQDGTGDYDTGSRNYGTLTTPPIFVPSSVTAVEMDIHSWYQTEPTTATLAPVRQIYVSINGGTFYPLFLPFPKYNHQSTWNYYNSTVSIFSGKTIRLQFRFDSVDALANKYRGWYLDDIEIREK
jgi:hypothetical protein